MAGDPPTGQRPSLALLFKRRPRLRHRRGRSYPLVPPEVAGRSPDLAAELRAIDEVVFPVYERFDQDALLHQNRYRRQQAGLILFGLLATAAGGLQAVDSDWTSAVGVAEAVLGAVLSVVAARLRSQGEQRRYTHSRLTAERLRGEGFLYLTRTGPYRAGGVPEELLRRRVGALAEEGAGEGPATGPATEEPHEPAGAGERSAPTGRDAAALAVYRDCRLEDQRRYYGDTRVEYELASEAAGRLALALSLSTAAAGVATAVLGPDGGWVLPLVATIVPALATALAGYAALYGFARLSKLYGDAEAALARLGGATADLELVARAEEVMRREQGQWGQFADEPPVAPGGGA
ncbi:MAG TPA: DUF4231 domain-containing protein [Thermoleophilaceae bacterium]|jgi:hypothetical protein